MRKDRTDSPLDPLTEAQQDELFACLQHMPYGKGVEWVQEHFAISTSTGGLQRWWRRQSNKRLRADIRKGLDTSKRFDKVADEQILDVRMRKALKSGFFELTAAGQADAAMDFATLALKANKNDQDAQRLQRLLAAERERDELQSEISNLKSQIATLTKAADARPEAGGLTPEGRKQVEEAMGVL